MKTGEQIVQALPWRWNVQGRIFIIGGLGFMFDAWDVVLNGFLTPLVGDYWDIGLGARSVVASANLLGMAAGAIGFSTLADRMGRKKAFSFTILVFAMFSVLGAFSPSFEVFVLLRFLAGIGLGGCVPVDFALVSEFSPLKSRGRVLAAMDGWWPIGGTICGVIATLLVPVDGDVRWRIMLAFMVLPALLLSWVRRGVPESPMYLANVGREAEARAVIDDLVIRTGAASEPYQITESSQETRMTVGAVIVQLRALWKYSPRITATVWALFVTVMVLYYAALSWMPSILRNQGYGEYAAFAGTTLMTGVGIIGVAVSAWLCEACGRKWTLGLSASAAGIALMLFAMALDSGSLAMILLGVFGFLIQVAIPVMYAYVSELYPTSLRASGFGWASSVGRIATGFTPLVFGTLLWPVFGLTVTFAITAVAVTIAVLWMAVGAPETRGRTLDTLSEDSDMPASDDRPTQARP